MKRVVEGVVEPQWDGTQQDGPQHDGTQHDGSQHDGTQPDGTQPDGTQQDGPELDPAIWPTGRLLSMAARLVEHAWNRALAEAGVTHAGLMVLHRLTRGAASQREVARTQGVQEQTIARTLAHLESGGFVQREIDPADRRRRIVQISPSGRELLDRLSGHGEALTEEILVEQGRDVHELRHTLAAIVSALGQRRWAEPDLPL